MSHVFEPLTYRMLELGGREGEAQISFCQMVFKKLLVTHGPFLKSL